MGDEMYERDDKCLDDLETGIRESTANTQKRIEWEKAQISTLNEQLGHLTTETADTQSRTAIVGQETNTCYEHFKALRTHYESLCKSYSMMEEREKELLSRIEQTRLETLQKKTERLAILRNYQDKWDRAYQYYERDPLAVALKEKQGQRIHLEEAIGSYESQKRQLEAQIFKQKCERSRKTDRDSSLLTNVNCFVSELARLRSETLHRENQVEIIAIERNNLRMVLRDKKTLLREVPKTLQPSYVPSNTSRFAFSSIKLFVPNLRNPAGQLSGVMAKSRGDVEAPQQEPKQLKNEKAMLEGQGKTDIVIYNSEETLKAGDDQSENQKSKLQAKPTCQDFPQTQGIDAQVYQSSCTSDTSTKSQSEQTENRQSLTGTPENIQRDMPASSPQFSYTRRLMHGAKSQATYSREVLTPTPPDVGFGFNSFSGSKLLPQDQSQRADSQELHQCLSQEKLPPPFTDDSQVLQERVAGSNPSPFCFGGEPMVTEQQQGGAFSFFDSGFDQHVSSGNNPFELFGGPGTPTTTPAEGNFFTFNTNTLPDTPSSSFSFF